MAALPDYVILVIDDAGEEFDAGVVQSEMERGLPKLRIQSTQVLMQITATLVFESRADTLAFDDWYFNTIGRIGFFDWLDPRTQTVRSVRFAGGALGKITPLAAQYAVAKRACTLEYLR